MRLLRSLLLVAGLTLMSQVSIGSITHLEFLGQARIPGGARVEETPVGGLSGITYDAARDLFYVVVDDPSARAPARFYRLEIDLGDGRLADDGVEVVAMTVIQSPAGGAMPKMTVDPEGIALHPDGSLYISSEGQVRQQVAPFVRHFALDGRYLGELSLPDRYQPSQDGSSGPRHNLGFESLTVTPDGRFLFTALENALIQDGPAATLQIASPSRLIKFDLGSGTMVAEYLYWAEPVAAPASVPEGIEVTGTVEMLALDEHNLLSMERSFSMGTGNTIRLFLNRLTGATNLQAFPALRDVELDGVVPVHKELLLDLADLGIYLDNLEGMTIGPPLQDGRQTLILVSDDNFNPLVQTTQILAFALGDQPVDVERVQGAGHRSPLEGRWVRGVEGVITGVYPEKEAGFWMESLTDDGDAATSRGLLVLHGDEIAAVSPGEHVVVDARVMETQRPGYLTTTTLQASRIEVIENKASLSPPAKVGQGGRAVPAEVVDNDSLQVFEPRFDGIDFWESLEGMRIVLTDARVVGPTNQYDELVVDASGGPTPVAPSRTGGLLLRPGDLNPERMTVDFAGVGEPPAVDVGARFSGPLVGVVGYRFGSYRIYVQRPLPRLVSIDPPSETTDLIPGENRLTVATFNVLNLSARSRDDHYRALAETLTVSMRGPDIVALQEIQDDSGPTDDGTVSAGETLQRLIDSVAGNDGPGYEYRQIDPVDNGDGGRPGANIRLAFLFNPRRVSLVERGTAGPSDAVRLVAADVGVGLSANPGRIAPADPAFGGDEERGFSASRKPLVAEFQFGPQQLFVINNHWSSKSSDDPVFGEYQPPVRHSEDQRSQQARLVADFVGELLRLDPDARIVVLGDLNDHEFRTPLRVLTGAPLENLVLRLSPEDRYSFNFRGNSQLLDHILVSRSLVERARARIDIVHVNSDRAAARSSSDHDPLIVELDFSSNE